jgi:hypothetical protein
MNKTVKIFAVFLLLLVSSTRSQASLINVKRFGAKGDGKTDDTKAIQAAINSASERAVNTIYFPKGIYLIGSYTTTKNYFENYCLQLHSRLIFRGTGNKSIIRLAANIFISPDTMANAHIFYGININNVSFTNLLIDMNGRNNLVPENIIKNHCAIFIGNGSDLTVKKITIKNCAGRNMIIIRGIGHKASIETSNFLNGGNYVGSATPNKFQTDFSFIYSEWDSTTITNNRIEQQNIDIALSGYTGGIEMHGSNSSASGNKITGCYPAIFVSSSWHATEKTEVKNNTMINCMKGVSFWVHYPMNEISIKNNVIQLTYSRLLKPSVIIGIEVPNGNSTLYGFKYANNAPLTNISITKNNISALLPDSTKDRTAGMVLHSFQNSIIAGNTISGMNYGGVILQGSKWGMDSLDIMQNTFTAFKPNNDTKAVGGYLVITDTYSINHKESPGMKKVSIMNNSFVRPPAAQKKGFTKKSNGQFFGAFVAVPQEMQNQIRFEKNQFSDKNENIYRVRSD